MEYQYTMEAVCIGRLKQEVEQSTITIALENDPISALGTTVTIRFKAPLSDSELSVLDLIIENHTGEDLPAVATEVQLKDITPTNLEKALKVQTTPLEGSYTRLFSPNLCDKTTWHNDSTKITQETLTTENNLTFSSVHPFWIDLVSGKIPYEDRLTAGGIYKVIVYVNGVVTTQGFSVDYINGKITFTVEQTGTVTATYWYAESFTWRIIPAAGKVLRIKGTKVKYIDNISWNDGQFITFQAYLNGSPFGSVTVYKNEDDMIRTADTVNNFTSKGRDWMELIFDYPTTKDLDADSGFEIRIMLINSNNQLGGTFAQVSADCISITT